MRDGLRHILEARWAPWLIVALTLLTTLRSVQLGFYNDDHALRAALQGTWPGGPPAWDLYRVSAVQDGRPSEVRITFDRPLDDPSIRLLMWKNNRLRQLTPPALSASAELPWSAGPLGVF